MITGFDIEKIKKLNLMVCSDCGQIIQYNRRDYRKNWYNYNIFRTVVANAMDCCNNPWYVSIEHPGDVIDYLLRDYIVEIDL